MDDDTAVELIDLLTEISLDLRRIADVLESDGIKNAITSNTPTVTMMPVNTRAQIRVPAPGQMKLQSRKIALTRR